MPGMSPAVIMDVFDVALVPRILDASTVYAYDEPELRPVCR